MCTEISLSEVLEVCEKYSGLGWALQEQLNDVIACGSPEEIKALEIGGKLNPCAMTFIEAFLNCIKDYEIGGVDELLDDIKEWGALPDPETEFEQGNGGSSSHTESG